ncbi:TrlF family ATPase, partial [Cohnella yongneupensis]
YRSMFGHLLPANFGHGRLAETNNDEKRSILRSVYRKNYAINNIVDQINHGNIGDFLKEVIFNGLPFEERDMFLKELMYTSQPRVKNYLKNKLVDIDASVKSRKTTIESRLNYFNSKYEKQFKVVYSPKEKDLSYFLEPLIDQSNPDEYIAKSKLTWDGVERFLFEAVERMGFIDFFISLLNDDFVTIEHVLHISDYSQNELSIRGVIDELQPVSSKNLSLIYKHIKNKITESKINLELCFGRYFEVIDDFSLLFNVNSKEQVDTLGPLLKDVTQLSLGQKVVAILTFIFEYGNYTNDNTPLIIDQPEDNLDNQYIYKNLVTSLRQIKNNRQVIVVTHISTIVTNADAEQVIVLDSDNIKGWIEKTGYPTDQKITKHIINYLEGGRPSFKHKINMYSTIINQEDFT